MNLLHANDRPGAYPASWYAAGVEAPPPRPPLAGDLRADVCVVGGGYTGLSAALCCAEAGLDVVLLEAQRLGFGASGRNGGQVGSGQRVSQRVLEARHGAAVAEALWRMGEDAKAEVQARIAKHCIDCGYRPGIAHAEWHASEVDELKREAEHLATRYGYAAIELLEKAGIAEATGSEVFSGGAVDRGAGHLHPLRFALGLAAAADAAGVRLHEGSEVTRIAPGPAARVETGQGAVTADHVILAANGYLGGLAPKVARHVMPINNFIAATEPLDAHPEILPGDLAMADSRFVVNYWRLSDPSERRLLFGGGESYGYRFPHDIAAKVRRPMREIYPQLGDVRIDHAWGGTLAITLSRMPAFLRPAPGILSASGYSGHGVALATLAGRAMAESVRGEADRFDLLADIPPTPFPGGTILQHPLLVLAMTWYRLRDTLGI